MTEMRAAVFTGPGKLALQSKPIPQIREPADVLVRVEACGICGTDLHILEDPPGHPAKTGVTLGHEIVGVVADTGPAAIGVTPGDRVVVAPNLSCGSCRSCKVGLFSACENFSTLGIFRDGGLADFVVAPARACHRIDAAIPRKLAALTEPLSCTLNGMRQAAPQAGEIAIIYGAGAIGLLFLAVLTAMGVRAIVVEPSRPRRDAAGRLGALRTVDPTSEDTAGIVGDLTETGVDLAIDAVGTQFAAAIAHCRPRGRTLLFGMNAKAGAQIAQYDITRKELVVFGTYVGDFTFPSAIRLVESGIAHLAPIVSHWLPLDDLPDALDALRGGSAVKAVIDIAGDEPA